MLAADEIEAALSPGYELRGLEVKGPGIRSDLPFFAKVARAMLSMANLRDGGHVIVGIDDTNVAALGPGLQRDHLASWLEYDDVARKLAEYADPPLRFDIADRTLSSGAIVAAIQVHEFADVPVLCKKDFPGVLRAGACYVRTRKVPETAEVPSATEMRDLLDLATEKALRAFVERAERAGVRLTTTPEPDASAPFREQRKDTW
ncbi:MAG TPA: RNA-binding domain-containing protein [Acidimicrobiales bacterium]|jgi:predicted HTH transcriptional regulator